MKRLFLSSILGLAACQRAVDLNKPVKLEEDLRQAKTSKACEAIIPIEAPPSWPVPTGRPEEFKIFFIPWLGAPGKLELMSPLGEAVLSKGSVASCVLLPGTPRVLGSRRWPEGLARLGSDAFEAKARRLYGATEEIGALYAAKPALSSSQKETIVAYGKVFLEMAEPDLLTFYRALNPDFWAWVKAAGGPTP